MTDKQPSTSSGGGYLLGNTKPARARPTETLFAAERQSGFFI
jgi:hypothetical protein